MVQELNPLQRYLCPALQPQGTGDAAQGAHPAALCLN